MDISSIAAAASVNAAAKVQTEASVRVLKMALDMQGDSVLQLLEALPVPAQQAPVVGSAAGGVVDTWA
ncbi:YjfB family protein [Thauera linaloolentis]|nr:YjfB family protein [Thauera linaloolentis]MCM8565917.1 YjfB family protein [Thauera linaloolentis]